MSFSFGQSSFGSGTKPTVFGTPFGSTPTTTSTGFGGFGTSFGAAPTASSAPAFGSTFGTPTASTSTAFGTAFGTPGANTTSTFGTSFGTPAASAAPAFGSTFGTPTATGGAFGTSTSAAPSLFGTPATKPSLFGQPAATTAPSLFSTPATGSNLFGSSTTTQAPNLFGATATSATPSLFGATSSAPSLFGTSFGSTTATTPSSGFFGAAPTAGLGTATTGSTGFNLFGTSTTTAPSLFSGFGPTTTSSSFTGFGGGTPAFGTGAGTTGFAGFGASSAQPGLFGTSFTAKPITTVAVQPTPESKVQQTLTSFYAINVFGDERDEILKKWNMLQACWGTGKGYYNATQPPLEYDHTNPFYRFKAIGYVVIPQRDNTDGLVKLQFSKKQSEIANQKDVLVNGIAGILGNKPNLTVTVEHIKGLTDNETEVMITVSEKNVTGTSRKIHASDLSAYLNQPTQKQQLTNVGVTFIGPYMMPTKAQLEEYLKIPAIGVDPQMWKAAQFDNPKPDKYLPTPLNGFTDLKKRLLCEENETGLHWAFIEKVNKEINEVKRKHAASIAQINEQKQKFLQLQHRVLRILVKQEVTRKVGMALQPEEELIRGRLELMHSQLGIPTQFKGQIHELLSSVKVINALELPSSENYKMEPRVQEDIKQFLQMEQNGIAHLINIINNDMKDLKIIQDGLTQFINK